RNFSWNRDTQFVTFDQLAMQIDMVRRVYNNMDCTAFERHVYGLHFKALKNIRDQVVQRVVEELRVAYECDAENPKSSLKGITQTRLAPHVGHLLKCVEGDIPAFDGERTDDLYIMRLVSQKPALRSVA
ncbi:MAG TPA: hypothetical protein VIN59_07025, partial [Alphaproteobacteria bacterium]